MCSVYPGKVKVYRVQVTQKNGDIYVQDRYVAYDSEKKRNRIVRSVLVGKIPKGTTEMIPTRGKRPSGTKDGEKSGNGGEGLTASRQHVGMMEIVAHVGEVSGIDDAVYAATDRATAQKIISIARCLVVSGGHTLPGMKMWQLNHPVPYDGCVTDDVYDDLLVAIGYDETLMQRFFAARCQAFLGKDDGVAYDSTTISTYSEQQELAAHGYNKAHDGLKTIRILTLYSVESRQPLAFAQYRPDIPDVSTVGTALAQLEALGVPSVELITDNGYYSQKNLSAMLWEGFGFITLVRPSIKWVRAEVDDHMAELTDDIGTTCPFDPHVSGVTVRLTRPFEWTRKHASHKTGAPKGATEQFRRRIYLHIFFDAQRHEQECASFRTELMETMKAVEAGAAIENLSPTLRGLAETCLDVSTRGGKRTVSYNKDGCRDATRYHGVFAPVSNRERECFPCLRKYRKREWVEDFFREGKQEVDGTRPRTWHEETLQGRLFVQFVALCYLEYLHEQVRQMKATLGRQNEDGTRPKAEIKAENKLRVWLEKNSLDDQLHWFDTKEEVVVSEKIHKHRWSTESTERDRLYLQKLGVIS